MSTFICAYSGLPIAVTHFPYNFSAGNKGRKLSHPIFNLTYPELASTELLAKWASGNMSAQDAQLYFLAILHSTELVTWRHSASPSEITVAANMADLITIAGWIYTLRDVTRENLPHVAIDYDNYELDNITSWIADWEHARHDYETGYAAQTREQAMMRKEDALERLIKNTGKTFADYAPILAEWADLSAAFPEHIREFRLANGANATRMAVNQYWRHLIITCAKTESAIWKLNLTDLQTLLTHLEDNVDAGTIYGHAVLALVRQGIATHQGYLDFQIVGSPDEAGNVTITQNAAESALSKILASEAPSSEPKEYEYPNKIAYLKAKIRWQQAQKLDMLASAASPTGL